MTERKYTEKKLTSHNSVEAPAETVWSHITRVQIAQFNDPLTFRVLDIPKPIRAEITQPG